MYLFLLAVGSVTQNLSLSAPQSARVFQLRRGTRPAQIHSLAFSPPGIEPPLLAECSSHGSVHVFRLAADESSRGGGRGLISGGVGAAAAAASGLLSSFVKVNVADMVGPVPTETCSYRDLFPEQVSISRTRPPQLNAEAPTNLGLLLPKRPPLTK
jgi:hypothetical protein